jgi:hypothetical protein
MIRFRRLANYVGYLFEKTLERQLMVQLLKQQRPDSGAPRVADETF